jgi:hypothetical protein
MLRTIAGALLVLIIPLTAVRVAVSPSRPAPTVPAAPISDSAFARLVERISEPGGFFDSDNLVSNEASYLHPIGAMRRLGVRGGAYIGVGPDQNFSYIARIRPQIAFIIDIRRDNLLQHLLFKALFERSRNRMEYLCLLTGRPVPDDLTRWTKTPIQAIVAHLDSLNADSTRFDSARAVVRSRVANFGIPVTTAELATIARIHAAFFEAGLDLRFSSLGRGSRTYYPTLRQLVTEKDLDGTLASYLANEDDFQFVKSLEARNLVVPVVGNLAGTHALREIGKVIAERGERVSALYVSNVEFYLSRDGTFGQFAETVTQLPRDQHSVMIRSYFGGYYGGTHPQAVPGYFSTQLLQTLDTFADEYKHGGYGSYFDVVNKHLVPLK